MAAGAVNLRKSHNIIILSFCNIVKGQAIYIHTKFFSSQVIKPKDRMIFIMAENSQARSFVSYTLVTCRSSVIRVKAVFQHTENDENAYMCVRQHRVHC